MYNSQQSRKAIFKVGRKNFEYYLKQNVSEWLNRIGSISGFKATLTKDDDGEYYDGWKFFKEGAAYTFQIDFISREIKSNAYELLDNEGLNFDNYKYVELFSINEEDGEYFISFKPNALVNTSDDLYLENYTKGLDINPKSYYICHITLEDEEDIRDTFEKMDVKYVTFPVDDEYKVMFTNGSKIDYQLACRIIETWPELDSGYWE